LLAAVTVLPTASCRKMNAFWHSDPMDWDSVYKVNLPKFEEADERVKAGQERMSLKAMIQDSTIKADMTVLN